MCLSLKKQILQSKISFFIKTYDFVFFLAIFNFPQKNRQQVLKNEVSGTQSEKRLSIANPKFARPKHLNIKTQNQKSYDTDHSQCLSYFYKNNLKMSPLIDSFKTRGENSLDFEDIKFIFKPQAEIVTLHLSNKNLKHHKNISDLPLHGPTLVIACRQADLAFGFYKKIEALYPGLFLGGFYKENFKTKAELKALCIAFSRKTVIYKEFLRLFSGLNIKTLKAISKVSEKSKLSLTGAPDSNSLSASK